MKTTARFGSMGTAVALQQLQSAINGGRDFEEACKTVASGNEYTTESLRAAWQAFQAKKAA